MKELRILINDKPTPHWGDSGDGDKLLVKAEAKRFEKLLELFETYQFEALLVLFAEIARLRSENTQLINHIERQASMDQSSQVAAVSASETTASAGTTDSAKATGTASASANANPVEPSTVRPSTPNNPGAGGVSYVLHSIAAQLGSLAAMVGHDVECLGDSLRKGYDGVIAIVAPEAEQAANEAAGTVEKDVQTAVETVGQQVVKEVEQATKEAEQAKAL